MRTTIRLARLSLLTALLFGAPDIAFAQESAGPFDALAARVLRGETLIVTTERGDRITGRLVSASGDSLILATGTDRRDLTPADVRKISSRDPTVLSAVIGAAAGFVGGWAVAASECRLLALREIFDDCSDQGSFTLAKTALFVFPAVGGVAGWAIDASKNATIYERGTTGVSVSSQARRGATVQFSVRF